MKKPLSILLVLLNIQACAETKDTQTSQVEHNKGLQMKTDTELFGKQPVYKLRTQTSAAGVVVNLNGVQIYENFSEGDTFNLATVNDLITSKDNTLSITLSSEKHLSSSAGGRVTLEVFSEGKHYIICNVTLDNSKKNKNQESTPKGIYSYDVQKGLYLDIHGKIDIGKTSLSPSMMYRSGKHDGLQSTLTFSLPTPFQRWKFLDSQNIIEEDYDDLTDDKYEQLKKSIKIQALYAIDAKIRKALKAKKPEAVLDLFNERFEENAKAYYDTPQSMRKEFLIGLKENLDDPDCELREYPENEHYFVIEKNRKLAWLRSIQFYNKKTKIYSTFHIKYRLDNKGKWVITH